MILRLEMSNDQRSRRLATFWTRKCKSLDVFIEFYQYSAAKKVIADLLLEWKEFEEFHNKYVTGINEKDRLQFVQITIITSECDRVDFLDKTLKYAMETGLESGMLRPELRDDKSSVLSGAKGD